MNSWHILKKFLKSEEIAIYINELNPLSSNPQIKNINDWNNTKREVIKEEVPVAPISKLQAIQPPQEGKNKKKNWKKPHSQSYRIPRIQGDAMDNSFNRSRTLIEFKDKEEQRMRRPHFPKKYNCLLMLQILQHK
ncbi:hypothetical protein O181_090946 [Austropuccinia psidii MF-1]|uniref:Uncharacterized protein n=1 Tax=Austropuccinia psidii MF-1 TaxID=1389203 RepID=A0A9Q3IWG0_9BASI|nr:hypothetical protein [Austropuccinia psidii MF-1]